ncbi:MAG TPA: YhcH/YjgK/YiaL family protein [Longimicrobium sp.]|nr:YhcH/YjgK/YiaL family protein [Longimicrobium sp.]
MIVTTLKEADRFAPLVPRMDEALAWLRAFDPALPDGRHAIDGDRLYALVSSYDTGPGTEKRFEAHRRNFDVQYVVSGVERILHTRAEGLSVEVPYDEAEDIVFFAEPKVSSSILMPAGSVALFWPGDAHKPGCMAGGRDPVRKVVVKVRL